MLATLSGDPFLPGYKGKTLSKFEQKLLNLVDKSLLQIAFPVITIFL